MMMKCRCDTQFQVADMTKRDEEARIGLIYVRRLTTIGEMDANHQRRLV
jgi:hypothetical protein